MSKFFYLKNSISNILLPMKMIQKFKHLFWLRSPVRVGYHFMLGTLAYYLSGNPVKDMYVIGVTGTKGKTTTSTLIARALEESGKKVVLLSTAQIWIVGDKRENKSKMTMNSPFRMWKHLREAKKKWATHLVLETSSHGIYYFRNYGIKYNAVLLTNISQDHLDLHGTMDHYAHTKARIFTKEDDKICVLPRDSSYFSLFYDIATEGNTPVNIITYSMKTPSDYYVKHLVSWDTGMELWIHSQDEETLVQIPIRWEFNAENVLWAYALLRTIDIPVQSITRAWKKFTGVPWRFELVPNEHNITVIVDYAHTEASLRGILQALQWKQKIILVFWATGDRDNTKRPKMWAVAHELTQTIVLTDDDTYTEPSKNIIDMVKKGIPRTIWKTYQIIPDRREAIVWAIKHAEEWNIVLIAGKGCETAQITNDWPIPWSDRGIAEKVLDSL